MKTKTFSGRFEQKLTFYPPNHSPLILPEGELTLIQKDEYIFVCSLKFEVDFVVYQYIEKEELFNLKSELKGKLQGKFNPENKIKFRVNLEPELLYYWKPYLADIDGAIQYLIDLVQNSSAHALINPQNWYAMSVEQCQGIEKFGYRTFWDYLNLSARTTQEIANDQLVKAIVNFSKEQAGIDLSEMIDKIKKESEQFSSQQIVESLNADLQSLLESILEDSSQENEQSSDFLNTVIFDQMLAFFKEDDWSIQIDEEQSGFRMMAQGENGQWPCYAQALDEKKQFVFYSISPVNVPQSQIPRVLDFLNRINLELMVGNFQLDPKDGQVVCKTSVDVGSDQLSTALVKQVVYNNVLTMNQCLPGLMSMIYANLSPEQALAKVFES